MFIFLGRTISDLYRVVKITGAQTGGPDPHKGSPKFHGGSRGRLGIEDVFFIYLYVSALIPVMTTTQFNRYI